MRSLFSKRSSYKPLCPNGPSSLYDQARTPVPVGWACEQVPNSCRALYRAGWLRAALQGWKTKGNDVKLSCQCRSLRTLSIRVTSLTSLFDELSNINNNQKADDQDNERQWLRSRKMPKQIKQNAFAIHFWGTNTQRETRRVCSFFCCYLVVNLDSASLRRRKRRDVSKWLRTLGMKELILQLQQHACSAEKKPQVESFFFFLRPVVGFTCWKLTSTDSPVAPAERRECFRRSIRSAETPWMIQKPNRNTWRRIIAITATATREEALFYVKILLKGDVNKRFGKRTVSHIMTVTSGSWRNFFRSCEQVFSEVNNLTVHYAPLQFCISFHMSGFLEH